MSLIISILLKGFHSKTLVIFVALIFCGSHYVNRQSQKNILLDNLRWVNVTDIFRTKALREFLTTSEEVYAPILWDHSWWMGFHRDLQKAYWYKYTQHVSERIYFVQNRSRSGPISIFDYQGDAILLAYKSDNIKKEIFNIIVAHPIGESITLISEDRLKTDSGLTNCYSGYCETTFHGIFKSNIFMITASGRFYIQNF
jgi:hypothetical protein